MKCVIMRGISGSGKTTYLKKNFPEFTVVSADKFFEREDGSWRYDETQINQAHAFCVRQFTELVVKRAPLIAVDNTNLRIAELAVYTQLAAAHGFDTFVFTLLINPAMAAARSVHAVPVGKVHLMANSMDALPPWLTQYLITPDIVDVFCARDVVFNSPGSRR